jgi:spermidine synthase
MAVREVLQAPRRVEQVTLVELDPHMTRCSPAPRCWRAERRRADVDRRVKVVNTDAFTWLEAAHETFDVIVVDFPRPHQLLAGQALHHQLLRSCWTSAWPPGGYAVVQTTSPLVARQSFWTVVPRSKRWA